MIKFRSILIPNSFIRSPLFRIQEPFALFDELYDKPWLRAGPYFVGIITGYILFKTNCKLKLPLVSNCLSTHTISLRLYSLFESIYLKKKRRFESKKWILNELFQIARLIGWALSTGIMFSVVYGLYPGNLTVPLSSVYAALGHTAWAIGVSFIVIQCCTGSATMIDSLLSLRLIYPLSRLTYCAYLVHPIIMLITASQMDGPLHLHNDIVVSEILEEVFLISIVSFFILVCAFQADSILWQSGRLLLDVVLHLDRVRGAGGQSVENRFHLEEEGEVEG